jgi:hypothetical protein
MTKRTRNYDPDNYLVTGPASPSASTLAHQILEAIDCGDGRLPSNELAARGLDREEIRGQVAALESLGLIITESGPQGKTYKLSRSGQGALRDGYLRQSISPT